MVKVEEEEGSKDISGLREESRKPPNDGDDGVVGFEHTYPPLHLASRFPSFPSLYSCFFCLLRSRFIRSNLSPQLLFFSTDFGPIVRLTKFRQKSSRTRFFSHLTLPVSHSLIRLFSIISERNQSHTPSHQRTNPLH